MVSDRDVKLENILLSFHNPLRKQGTVTAKLADFGFSAFCCGLFDASGHYGTRGYIAPEIYRERAYGKPIDMW